MNFPADAETVRAKPDVKVQAATAILSNGNSIRLSYPNALEARRVLANSKWLATRTGWINSDHVVELRSGEWYQDVWSF